MDPSQTFYNLGISLGLGLLVGLQRERSDSRLAGFRTFPLITLLGTVASLLSLTFGGWTVAVGLLALAGIIIEGNLAAQRTGDVDPGLTTEAAMSNLVFKAATVAVLGNRQLLARVGTFFGGAFVTGAVILGFWPR